jgi:transposase
MEMFLCSCATRWEQFIPMTRLLICFPHTASLLKRAFRLALITIFQFMEHLTDRQAADAVRDRLAWKYALSLELTDTGFDHTVLSEFRARLVEGNAQQRLLDLLLERCREGGWLKAGGRQRPDSTHVLAKIRALNRTLCVAQTMVYVLNVHAAGRPRLGSCLRAS